MLLLLQIIFSEALVLFQYSRSAIMFNCGPIVDASLVLDGFFGRSRILSIFNLTFKVSFTMVFFQMVDNKKLFRSSRV